MKYKLTETSTEYNAKNKEVESLLGIPSGSTSSYAIELLQVNNSSHSDYGKYLFPVVENGAWKCDQHFEASELKEYDSDWFLPIV